MSVGVVKILATSKALYEIAGHRSKGEFSALDAGILISGALQGRVSDDAGIERVTKLIIEKSRSKPATIISSILLMLKLAEEYECDVTSIVPCVAAILFYRLENLQKSVEVSKSIADKRLKDVLFSSIVAEFEGRNLFIIIDFQDLYDELCSTTHIGSSLENSELTLKKTYKVTFDVFFSKIEKAYHPLLRSFYEKDAEMRGASLDHDHSWRCARTAKFFGMGLLLARASTSNRAAFPSDGRSSSEGRRCSVLLGNRRRWQIAGC